jgi:hypothetical protein
MHFTGALEEEVRKAQQCARKYQSNLDRKYQSNLGRRQIVTGLTAIFLGLLLEKWPQGKSKTAQHEIAWQEFGEIRRLLWLDPPDQSAAIARARAAALQEVLAPLASKDRTTARIRIYCEEIKRDAGVAGESEEVLNQIEKQVEIVEQLWKHEHDHLNFASALLTHANLDRIRRDWAPNEWVAAAHAAQSKRRILAALNVLAGPCYKQDRVVVNILRYYATLLRFRLEAFGYRDESAAEQRLAKMQQIEEQIKEKIESPHASIETLRERAGYCQGLKHDLDEANTLLKDANAHFQKLGHQPIVAHLSLLRPKLEILYERQDQSFEKELKEYLILLRNHPSAYHVNQIRNLIRAIGKDPTKIDRYIPAVRYTTPLLPYLYYEDFSLRREGVL